MKCLLDCETFRQIFYDEKMVGIANAFLHYMYNVALYRRVFTYIMGVCVFTCIIKYVLDIFKRKILFVHEYVDTYRIFFLEFYLTQYEPLINA